eukprot:Platyproteum_vivax@DN12969_c0_g1_i1.p1
MGSKAPSSAKLLFTIHFESGNIEAASAVLDSMSRLAVSQSPPMLQALAMNQGCVLFRQGALSQACAKFTDTASLAQGGAYPYEAVYNRGLCLFKERRWAETEAAVEEILRAGRTVQEAFDDKMPQKRRKKCVIEACNLKAAVAYIRGNPDKAKAALQDVPVRSENEIDAVTLHNTALFFVDQSPNE